MVEPSRGCIVRIDTLRLSSAHLNRFVREYSFLALADLVTVAGRQGARRNSLGERSVASSQA